MWGYLFYSGRSLNIVVSKCNNNCVRSYLLQFLIKCCCACLQLQAVWDRIYSSASDLVRSRFEATRQQVNFKEDDKQICEPGQVVFFFYLFILFCPQNLGKQKIGNMQQIQDTKIKYNTVSEIKTSNKHQIKTITPEILSPTQINNLKTKTITIFQ